MHAPSSISPEGEGLGEGLGEGEGEGSGDGDTVVADVVSVGETVVSSVGFGKVVVSKGNSVLVVSMVVVSMDPVVVSMDPVVFIDPVVVSMDPVVDPVVVSMDPVHNAFWAALAATVSWQEL